MYHAKHITVVKTYSGLKDTVVALTKRHASILDPWIVYRILKHRPKDSLCTLTGTFVLPRSQHKPHPNLLSKFPHIRQISAGFHLVFIVLEKGPVLPNLVFLGSKVEGGPVNDFLTIEVLF